MSRAPREYLRHILDEATYLLEATEGLDQSQLLQDETLKRAVVRSIEVIGEAANALGGSPVRINISGRVSGIELLPLSFTSRLIF